MEKVTTKEAQRKFGQVRKQAHKGGVMITHHGHDDLALVPADVYKRLVAMDLQSHDASELPEHIVNRMEQQPLSADAHKFDHEYTG